MGSSSDAYGSDAYDNCRRIAGLILDAYDPSNPTCHCTKNAISTDDIALLSYFCDIVRISEVEEKSYSKPMLWIGIYIAVASFFCILLMAADLFHGFRNRKLWFPSKYFTLNAASITVITVAMKLPVDLSGRMPTAMEQFAKMGSATFLCTMMANCIPSLASMDNTELFANVAGMVILVITVIVNLLIQMETGVVDKYDIMWYKINIGAMLLLMLLMVSLALTVPTAKRKLELKYQAVHKTTLNDLHSQHRRMSTVEELTKHVRKYWMMAGTCSPQFVMITTPLCSMAGVICVSTAILHYVFFVYIFIIYRSRKLYLLYESDYKWSILVIYITQSIGITLGTIAPVFRCFAVLRFKLSIKWIKTHSKVWKVEKYWTQKLSEWKKIPLDFQLGGRTSKALVHNLCNLTVNVCIICQKVLVVLCKIIGLIPLGMAIISMCCVCCWKSLKAKLCPVPIASNGENIHVVQQNYVNQDIGNYVVQLQDEMKLDARTLKSISNSVNYSIQKASKQQPSNLLKLIENFEGFEGVVDFEGVVNFDSDDVLPLISDKFPNSWSLPVVSLTCVAISLPNIGQDFVDHLLKSVCEGLSYTFLVEESLNNTGQYNKVHKSTIALWQEVEINYRWLGYTLQRNAHKHKSMKEILKWFADKSEEIVVEINKHNNEELLDNTLERSIAANSMYRITRTILVNYPNDIECSREEKLFGLLSSMIVDIFLACFVNLPRVIEMKCHDQAIEKREASVRAAAKLLGSTKKIIEKLQMCEVPSLDRDQIAFIDEWRAHLKHSIP
ncbi:hypothetical protein OSB04_022423 [Centaurea solstitialis]|uniref:Uncharacterized protein n=1 Tax=Centaurea solstitialis TaxID=347529 RepID=A0AA38T853_9ASTR|nr:hypothetical protein OSB04_022423 [Centaurea solstitialis]